MPASSGAEAPPWLRALTAAEVVSGVPASAPDITHDSRRVVAGGIFVAIPGAKVDGASFIAAAIAAGAGAIIVQADTRAHRAPLLSPGVAFVAVPDARAALAEAASGLYGEPARSLVTVGVTGTDGKTTTTHLIAHVLSATGRRCGYLSSVAFSDGVRTTLNASHMTTLEASDVQRELRSAVDAGAAYAVIEASSIGLELHRVDRCEFRVAVFTNLTPDHLDFHGSMEAYLAAKARLFALLRSSAGAGAPKAAVVNADDPASAAMRAAAGGVPAISYGFGDADIRAHDIERDTSGMRFVARMGGEEVIARTPLPGDYNVANCLAAVAVAVSQGARFSDAVAALSGFPGVPGRMELIEEGQPYRVVVDIASTEPAMRNVLAVLRPATRGKLIVVFGAAGERDVGRRSGIAHAVAAGADFAVVANEDPRREDPDAIIDAIARALAASGFEEGSQFVREPDRRRAIALAFEHAGPGDTVLLAGKGTEQSIVVGTAHLRWDERQVARQLLRRDGGV
ncbi:MAG: UDP-N-acetylmuramoyl-L-alanyl-D-glutamate--2,6-diaminopimelate ligase [Dehalococcoidia bacterium]|nr:UDP-N-acetylmuramoyl-L-alanyl-D-glutamate--2,6-diaminopimelate ligase [Dehalococcoidia bacterium]